MATLLLYAAFAICVAISCFTNDIILGLVRSYAHLGPDWPSAAGRVLPYAAADRYDEYLLGSIKGAAFFAGLLVFAFLLRRAALEIWPALCRRKLWVDLLIGVAIASIFLFEIVPTGMGRIYAYNSVEPFLQHQGFFHRRILMPVLAHELHLDGVLYGVFHWIVALSAFALASLYLARKGLLLSRLELASLYTTGILATALGLPGHGEILVFWLTLLAMLDHDRAGSSGIVQPVCFALALLTHESAAVLAFGTLALTYFDRRFLPHFLGLLALYLLIWLASFGFDQGSATAAQLTGGTSNFDQFTRTLPLVLFSLFAAYKLTLVAAVAAMASLAKTGRPRLALLIALALGGGLALTAIATDYTRMAAFGGFAMLVALPVALKPLSPRTRMALASANLLIPTLYVAAHHGAVTYHGLYGLVLTHFFGMRG
ncbi:hypothetical protein OF829_05315 [Sphingomonas sp. LB-2]|uniref:hypothetical protein n=1 Tax=Sphingomonas caeni TaxID=2984949 RepID=UPI002232A7F6|nr:hypothetical protein [Sphingomonas caeni]MCW3846649.1 hypothetical protein [Sphingomonas caeni]